MNVPRVFIDTNVVLYLFSGELSKAERAEDVIAAGGFISIQVLNEFVAVARRKRGMAWPDIRQVLDTLRAICAVESMSLSSHERAMDIAERTGYSICDSLILACALNAGCHTLYSEDMQHGQVIDGQLTILNPFRA
jgi:predicted nucleic acid-binding protein